MPSVHRFEDVSKSATRRSNLSSMLSKLPLLFSFGILAMTWVAFMFTITIPQVLLHRHAIWHFLEQFVVFNSLMGLTMLSLFTAATRSPGHPDPALALFNYDAETEQEAELSESTSHSRLLPSQRMSQNSHSKSRPSTLRLANTSSPKPAATHADASSVDEPGDEADDIPLRYLRNSHWVNSRSEKDRPSPLPLRSNRDHQAIVNVDAQSPDSENHMPAISPFPLGLSPFVPATITEAGGESDWTDEDLTANGDVIVAQDAGMRFRRKGYWMDQPDTATSEEEDQDAETMLEELESGVAALLLEQSQESGANGSEGKSQALMAKGNTGGPRFCRKCRGWKPDRCHHCSFCQTCVLKMDHHCVWLSTCIGHRNYKPFLLFITYGTILAIYIALEGAYQVYTFFTDEGQYEVPNLVDSSTTISSSTPVEFSPLVFMILTMVGGFFTLAVGGLAGYHWYLVCNNLSTLESMSYTYPSALLPAAIPTSGHTPTSNPAWKPDHLLTRPERRRLSDEARDINVYDLGWRRNIKQTLLGDSPALRHRGVIGLLYAIWPLSAARNGNGHEFDYDEEKLGRLRRLTGELRLGVRREDDEDVEEESDDD